VAAIAAAVPAAAVATPQQAAAPGGLQALAQAPVVPPIATQRIYFVMLDRYANGDPSNDRGGLSGSSQVTGFDPTNTGFYHGGDLEGLVGTCDDPVHGLARVRDLGFTALWITPVVKQQTVQGSSAAYHGYWGLDFTTVDPHLGTEQDLTNLVTCAHGLGLKVYLDVVVNHTADVITPTGGSSYVSIPYRDCHGRVFDPARYVRGTFPCLKPANMPNVPLLLPGSQHLKKPAWLNDPTAYHDRGDIDFSSCSQTCLEQGDFFGLDDLFTEQPRVERGLADIYASWITRFHLDGFRVDTARHVNAAFFRLWVPQIMAAANAAGVPGFQIFGEVSLTDQIELSTFVRDRGLPNVLDFPFQNAAADLVAGHSALELADRLNDDDYFRGPSGVEPSPPTFLGNHDMGRAAEQIEQRTVAHGDELLSRMLLGYDVLYLLRGAPVVDAGDEVGMMGSGGDQAAREDMFPTQVQAWQTEERVGAPPIGTGSSFDVRDHPIELRLRQLAALRDAHPALAAGATIIRSAKHAVLAVSRIDAAARREYVVAFNAGTTAARLSLPTATPSSSWTALLGAGPATSTAAGTLSLVVPPLSTVVLEADSQIPAAAPPRPALRVGRDDLTPMWRLSASVPAGTAPLSVTFGVRRQGSSSWQRLAVDDSPPYRAFLQAGRYRRGERLQLAAVARSLDGRTAVSAVTAFRVHPTS
jgi:glycosidase